MVATKDWNPTLGEASPDFKTSYGPWDVLNCSLHHAIYAVNITSSASNVSDVAGFNVDVQDPVSRPIPSDGTIDSAPYTDATPPSSVAGAAVNGYMALLSGFFDVIGGYITDQHDPGSATIESKIESSILMYTRELLQYRLVKSRESGNASGVAWWALTDAERQSDTLYPEEAFKSSVFNQSLGSAMEDLFPKMVLSLFSNPLFVQEAGQSTNVTIHSWPNVYTYRRRNLMISYGVALALTMLSCGFGCATIYLNRASYSNSLSTVLRVTRGHLEGFDPLLTDKDQTGADPLPSRLAKARIQLGPGIEEEANSSSQDLRNAWHLKPLASTSERSIMMRKQGFDEAEHSEVNDFSTRRSSRENHQPQRTSENAGEGNTMI